MGKKEGWLDLKVKWKVCPLVLEQGKVRKKRICLREIE